MTSDPVDDRACPARWLEISVLVVGSAVGVVGSVGLALAVVGQYTTWLTLVISAPLVVGAGFLAFRAVPGRPTGRAAHWAGAAAVLMALAFGVFAGATPSQNVIVARDPGSYMNTAKWLTEDGTLRVDPEDGAFDGIDGLRYTSAALYIEDDGDLEFQFNHLASVVMAVADDVGGYRLLLRTPALASAVGLVALYAVAARVLRRPVLALLPPALFAVCLPLLHVSRNTYSEPFAFLLLWTAILALSRMHRRPTVAAGAIGGVLLGAGLCVRIDSLVYVALVFPLAALSLATSPTEGPEHGVRIRAWSAALLGLVVVGGVGVADLQWRTGQYMEHLADQVSLMRMAFLGSLAVSVIGYVLWRRVAVLRRVLPPILRAIAPYVGILVAAVLFGAWLLRPELQTARGPTSNSTVESLQRQIGERIDGRRTYAEDSMRWMSWYLGAPALAAMIVGTALTVKRTLSGTARPAAVLVAAVVLGAGGLYLWNPSITPDQLWATRRYVPAILPAMAIMAALTLAWVDSTLSGPLRGRQVDRRVRLAVIGALSLLLVVPAAVTTWPLRSARAQAGHLQMVLEACDIVGDDGAIIVLGGVANTTLAQTLRSWCGVPVAGQGDAVNSDTVAEVAAQVSANGYEPFLIGANRDHLDTFVAETGREPVQTHKAVDDRTAGVTIETPPSEFRPYDEANPIAEPFQLYLLPLAGLNETVG